MSDIAALIKIVGKDFELPNELSEIKIREVLVNAFAYLMEEDFQKLLQILYRADVDQDRLKVLLETTEGKSPSEVIADAYIARQQAKIETWKKYSSK